MWQKVLVTRIQEFVMIAARPTKDPASDRSLRLNSGLVPLILLLPLFAMAQVVVPIDSVENSVNIRMSADSKSEIVGKLRQGDSLPLVQSVTDWHVVDINGGATGYISADWSRVLEERPDDEPQVSEAVVSEDEADVSPAVEAVADTVETNIDQAEVLAVVEHKTDQESVPESAIAATADTADTVLETQSDDARELEEIQLVVRKMQTVSTEEQVVALEDDASAQASAPGNSVADESATKQETVADTAVEESTQADVENVAAGRYSSAAMASNDVVVPIVVAAAATQGAMGPPGPAGPPGLQGPSGQSGAATIEGSPDFLMKFSAPTIGANSQVYDDGNNIGIGTTEPKQRLEVNGNIQIHERNSSVAGLMITQASGDTGYIMHNQASTLTIGAGSIDRITINRDGNIGMGVNRPAHPIEMASGAYVSAGGVWTNSSSRHRKENIVDLTPEEALAALVHLQPVEFNYKNDQQEKYVGFIAEDVPDLVATEDRQSLSTMDIVAVLTKVVQEQQKKIAALEAKLEQR
jgi:hypothetical protein